MDLLELFLGNLRLSQPNTEEIASGVGKSRRSVQLWLKGKRVPSLDTLGDILESMGIPEPVQWLQNTLALDVPRLLTAQDFSGAAPEDQALRRLYRLARQRLPSTAASFEPISAPGTLADSALDSTLPGSPSPEAALAYLTSLSERPVTDPAELLGLCDNLARIAIDLPFGNRHLFAASLGLQATAYRLQGLYRSASHVLRLAIPIGQQVPCHRLQVSLYLRAGALLVHQLRYDDAIKVATEAAILAFRALDFPRVARALTHLGTYLVLDRQRKLGIEILGHALAGLVEDDIRNRVAIHSALALAHIERKEPQMAASALAQALRITPPGDGQTRAVLEHRQADLCLETGDLRGAERHLRESTRLFSVTDPIYGAYAAVDLMDTLLKLGEPEDVPALAARIVYRLAPLTGQSKLVSAILRACRVIAFENAQAARRLLTPLRLRIRKIRRGLPA